MKITTKGVIIAVVAFVMLTSLADILIPDQTVEYRTRTVTKHVKDEKVIKVSEVPYDCLQLVRVSEKIEEAAIALAAIPDDLTNIISEIHQARAAGDSNREVKLSEKLSGYSDRADGYQATISELKGQRSKLRVACESNLK